MKLLTTLILAGSAALAQAQAVCSSDGQSAPLALAERFLSADCELCWSAPESNQRIEPAATLVLDWIVPSARGEAAALSAAATRDALQRLDLLHAAAPASSMVLGQAVTTSGHSLRVARGPALANYVGASIELSPPSGGPWTAVLLLVESIAAGSEGTPIARQLVRNMLLTAWDLAPMPAAPQRLFESRPMSLPEGTRPERVQVVGWVQDAQGQLMALAQSACPPPD